MRIPLRVGGRGRLPDGAVVTWSLAQGSGGRRWRASLTDRGELHATMLLEVDVGGRPTRLELATAVGLLTVHPESDGVLHGNVVTAAGVAPITLPLGARFGLDVARLPIGAAVACHALAGSVGVGESTDLPIVRLGHDLEIRRSVARIERRAAGDWAIDGTPLALDARGVPLFEAAREWPLEADGGGGHPTG